MVVGGLESSPDHLMVHLLALSYPLLPFEAPERKRKLLASCEGCGGGRDCLHREGSAGNALARETLVSLALAVGIGSLRPCPGQETRGPLILRFLEQNTPCTGADGLPSSHNQLDNRSMSYVLNSITVSFTSWCIFKLISKFVEM